MATEIRVPTLGESVTEATIGRWFKQPGEAVPAVEPVGGPGPAEVTVEGAGAALGGAGRDLGEGGGEGPAGRPARPDSGRRGARQGGRRAGQGRARGGETSAPAAGATQARRVAGGAEKRRGGYAGTFG